MTDIPSIAFRVLRNRLFGDDGRTIPFELRDKQNTQDDPLDEFLAEDVLDGISGIVTKKANGPLISPDMVLYRTDLNDDTGRRVTEFTTDSIIGLEVKKLERTRQGTVARASGLDYNTTPPCGQIRVYDENDAALDIRGFYLFVCIEADQLDSELSSCTGLVLADGNVLNDDFELYLAITGERTKRIGLGTYGDGVDRARPMTIFANPLGVASLDRAVTLIHADSDLESNNSGLQMVYEILRSVPGDADRRFYCYRRIGDVDPDWIVRTLRDPFPTPRRQDRTRPRGRFRLPFSVSTVQ